MNKFFKVISKTSVFLFAILLTALIASIILISLPFTEKYYNKAQYNLTLKEPYWEKEYTLDLEIKPKDIPYTDKKIEETKNVLFKRLNKYGVQNVEFKVANTESKTTKQLIVKVRSDKEVVDIDTLVNQRYYIRFVVAKEGVNFEDEENPYAQFDITNYEPTSYTRHDFRTVYLTKLNSTSGEKSYFAIYKAWENKLGEFYSDMEKLQGQRGGVAIDEFVSPAIFPAVTQATSNGSAKREPFAIGMSLDDTQAKIVDILFNSGVIPLAYTTSDQIEINVTVPELNYVNTIFGVMALTLTLIVVNYWLKKQSPEIYKILALVLTLAGWIASLKLLGIGISLLSLFISTIIFIGIFLMLLFVGKFRRLPLILIITSLLSIYFFGAGYIKEISATLLLLTSGYLALEYFSDWYLRLVNRVIS